MIDTNTTTLITINDPIQQPVETRSKVDAFALDDSFQRQPLHGVDVVPRVVVKRAAERFA